MNFLFDTELLTAVCHLYRMEKFDKVLTTYKILLLGSG